MLFKLGKSDMDVQNYFDRSVVRSYQGESYSDRSQQSETSIAENVLSNEGILFVSTSLVGVAILATLAFVTIVLKRLAFSKALGNRSLPTRHYNRASCEKCQFFNKNPYLKCAVHPAKVLTAEAKDCPDYSPPHVDN
jgi:hypothetical protein